MTDKWEPTLTAQRDVALNSDAPLSLLYLPGLLCDTRLWSAQILALGDVANATVASLDSETTMEALAASALEQAPEGAFMLAGLSMGGYVALEIMRQQPQRVLGLALLSTSARPDTPNSTHNRRMQIEQAETDFEGIVDALLPRLLHPAKLLDADIAATVHAMAHELGPEVFRRQQEAIISRQDSLPHLHEISCPTLIICGREDKITPLDVHSEMASRIPGAQLSIIEHCGHLSPLEQPGQVTNMLRSWLMETHRGYALR